MITINLLPKHLRPVKRTPIPHILSILVLVAAVVAMGLVFVTVRAQLIVVRNQLAGVNQELGELQGIVDEYDQLLKEKARVADKIKAIEEISSDRIIWSRQLYNLSRLAPDNLWYTEIAVATKKGQKTEPMIGQDGKVVLDPATKQPRMGTVNIDIPVLRVSGYVIETPDGRLDTGSFARATEKDEEFFALFQFEPPRVQDTVYEGYRVREFTFEFVIRKGGEST
ncbi:MAG: hypothetical protein U9Q79_05060 [Candidatus Hydrogenedentes bacterium]|nr:hypothetical protein [Candidatus Hydrogenedentota bacterium]